MAHTWNNIKNYCLTQLKIELVMSWGLKKLLKQTNILVEKISLKEGKYEEKQFFIPVMYNTYEPMVIDWQCIGITKRNNVHTQTINPMII